MLVRQANTQDLDAVCAVFASAFDRTAQWQWMIPDDDVRRPALNVLVRPLVQHALKVGQLDVAEVELVPYYERFGFEVVHRIEGEDIPLQIGMWRN